MSRVGKVPITVPSGIEVKIEGSRITVKGPKGELSRDLIPDMKLNLSDGVLTVARPGDHPRHRAAHGLTRTLIYNMVIGVSEGFAKTLELQGVGYRAQMQGANLVLAVGYSKPVEVPPPRLPSHFRALPHLLPRARPGRPPARSQEVQLVGRQP